MKSADKIGHLFRPIRAYGLLARASAFGRYSAARFRRFRETLKCFQRCINMDLKGNQNCVFQLLLVMVLAGLFAMFIWMGLPRYPRSGPAKITGIIVHLR